MLTKGKKHHHHQFESKNPSFGHQKNVDMGKKNKKKTLKKCFWMHEYREFGKCYLNSKIKL